MIQYIKFSIRELLGFFQLVLSCWFQVMFKRGLELIAVYKTVNAKISSEFLEG